MAVQRARTFLRFAFEFPTRRNMERRWWGWTPQGAGGRPGGTSSKSLMSSPPGGNHHGISEDGSRGLEMDGPGARLARAHAVLFWLLGDQPARLAAGSVSPVSPGPATSQASQVRSWLTLGGTFPGGASPRSPDAPKMQIFCKQAPTGSTRRQSRRQIWQTKRANI